MSKLLDAIAEVSSGGIFSFSAEDVASQLGQPVSSIKKRIRKLKKSGVIDPLEIGVYPTFAFTVSEDWADRTPFVEKREQIFDQIRKNILDGNVTTVLPEPLPDEIAGKVWDVTGNPISPNQN